MGKLLRAGVYRKPKVKKSGQVRPDSGNQWFLKLFSARVERGWVVVAIERFSASQGNPRRGRSFIGLLGGSSLSMIGIAYRSRLVLLVQSK